MKANTSTLSALAGALLVLTVNYAPGQTIIIEPRPVPPRPHPVPPVPRPTPPQRNAPLELRKHTVEVSIVDGTATTAVDQVFFNPHPAVVEGAYVFPLEGDVAVSRFSMFVNGEEVEGKLLGVEEAHREYESIVAKMRDPALLEYLGTRMFRARIFPIRPQSEVRIRLSYSQMLRIEDGLVRYRYPLNVERHLASPIGELSLLVNIESQTPIKSVFSPSHTIAVSRATDKKVAASFEGKNALADKDFELYYALSEKEFGITVLTHRAKGRDGFFLVRIAPPVQPGAKDVLPKDVAFVLDTSGSMSGEKIEQARKALLFCLDNLHPEDRFNVIRFSHEAVSFRDVLVPADRKNVEAARDFVNDLRAGGGTNIHDAVLAALDASAHVETDRPYLVVFLTDGQPTAGITQPDEILKSIARRNEGRVRLFVLGVGYDVNTRLLDLLAEQNRGTRDYVEPGEDLELKLSSFYRKIAEPVLADLSLKFDGLKTSDVYPPKPGDLFAGSELVVVGRYKGEGTSAVELRGTRRGRLERFVDERVFPAENRAHEFLPRLWATRKIGFLLDELRLRGENKELKDTIVDLATAYGIVTPYTAYLVTEPEQVAVAPQGENVMRRALHADATLRRSTEQAFVDAKAGLAPSPGGGAIPADGDRAFRRERAVMASKAIRVMREVDDTSLDVHSDTGDEASDAATLGAIVKRVGSWTFYRIKDRWVDAAWDDKDETRKVELFSDEYFKLIRKHPELARCFALGERVVVVVGGTAYETVPGRE